MQAVSIFQKSDSISGEDSLAIFLPARSYFLEILSLICHQVSGTCYINSKIAKVGWKPKSPHIWSEI